jgi:hypothetical protein
VGRTLHQEETYDLYCSVNVFGEIKSRIMRVEAYVARIREMRGAFRVLVGKSEGMNPLGKPRRRWENNVKIDL